MPVVVERRLFLSNVRNVKDNYHVSNLLLILVQFTESNVTNRYKLVSVTVHLTRTTTCFLKYQTMYLNVDITRYVI